MTKKPKSSRREFIVSAGMATAGMAFGASGLKSFGSPYGAGVLGSNEKIRVGFIGVGNRGSQLLHLFMSQPDCEIAALCDVYEPYVTRDRSAVHPRHINDMDGQIPRMGEKFPNTVSRYADYRDLLEDKSIDAVCIATPDHWHCLQTIHAIQSGKDVFVEKPLTITIKEGRMMVDAERNSKQLVAVGLNRRGSVTYQKLSKDIPAGKIGKVTCAFASRINNMYPDGIGRQKPEDAPVNFNWDAWVGPRAYRPYQYNIAPYMFRWWSDYSSQMGNWGVHYMDVIRWMMNEQAPVAISAHGGKFAVDDDRDIPDTMHVTYEFASGSIVTFSIYEASSNRFIPYGEVELRGTKASLFAGEGGYRIMPTSRGQFQTWDKLADAEEFAPGDEMLADGSSRNSTLNLVRNFLDCVKSRNTPLCTLEDGHRSTSFAHLGNIALATGQRLRWDPVKEIFPGNEEANRLLHYEYRKPYVL
ncbi:MAG: Gfo/Idh/MocA family oxidoreductase [Bacteroidales bacterium]